MDTKDAINKEFIVRFIVISDVILVLIQAQALTRAKAGKLFNRPSLLQVAKWV